MSMINFSATKKEVQEQKPRARFTPGNYKFQVVSSALGESPEKKTPRIELKLLVTTPHGDQYTVIDDIYLVDNSKWRYIQFMNCVGADPTNKKADTDSLPGLEGVLRMRPQKDSDYMEVGEFYHKDVAKDEKLGAFPAKTNGSDEANDDVPW